MDSNNTKQTQPDFKNFIRWGVFSTGDVADIVKVPIRKVLQWVDLGVLKPWIPSRGTGSSRGFGFREVIHAALARELEGLGIASRHLASFSEAWAGSVSQDEGAEAQTEAGVCSR